MRVVERAAHLFNRKLYFECHDLLEEAWAEARGEERAFLNALIHVAVGMYHLAAGNHRGAASQLNKAVRGLEPFRPEREGLDIEELAGAARRCLEKLERVQSGETVTWVAEDIPRMSFHRAV